MDFISPLDLLTTLRRWAYVRRTVANVNHGVCTGLAESTPATDQLDRVFQKKVA